MAVPLRQNLRIGTYLLKHRVKKTKYYPFIIEIEPLFAERIRILERSIEDLRSKHMSAGEEITLTMAGPASTRRIDAIIEEMESAERDLLRQRNAAAKTSAERVKIVLLGGTLVSIVILLGVFAVLYREVAERTRAEEEVNRFFDVTPDLLCIAGMDGYFKRLNPAWEKVLGYTLKDLKAKPYVEFVHPEDRSATQSTAQNTASGEGTETFENRYQAKDGSYHWLSWVFKADPRRSRFCASARDVTQSKKSEETMRRLNEELEARTKKLEEINKELEAFTYSVSHDLRAPLRHVDGFSRLLLEEYGEKLGPEGKRMLERVRQGTQNMGELVDDLLNLSRVSRREVNPLVTDLNTILEEVLTELKPTLQGRQVEFRAGQLPFAQCDPGLIRQVFANLLSNAIKFTRPRERAVIEVGQSQDDGRSAVFVRDNGVGFSMKYADKLFGVFQRLHRAEDFEGTGVGLATVQRIIEKHGGRIWVDAEIDKGATFYFTLEGLEDARPANTAVVKERRMAQV